MVYAPPEDRRLFGVTVMDSDTSDCTFFLYKCTVRECQCEVSQQQAQCMVGNFPDKAISNLCLIGEMGFLHNVSHYHSTQNVEIMREYENMYEEYLKTEINVTHEVDQTPDVSIIL